jgi:hypothetical protein
MRRRKPFTLAAGISAVLSIAVSAMWVRSCRVGDRVHVQWARAPDAGGSRLVRTWEIESVGGWVQFSRGHTNWSVDALRRGTLPHEYLESRAYHVTYKARPGAREGYRPIRFAGWRTDTAGYSGVFVPHWMLCVMLAMAPAAWLARRRSSRRRRRTGCCPACGYDLRATPDRCPECGAVTASKGERA